MAEDAQQEETKKEETTGKKPGKMFLVGGVILGMLVFQAAGVFIAVKFLNQGPAEAVGVELENEHKEEAGLAEDEETGEILIAKLRCPHTNTGRLYVVEMNVYALVPKRLIESGDEEGGGHGGGHGGGGEEDAGSHGIKAKIDAHDATIRDRMRTIVASADPGTLCLARSEKPDYGLSTLRRQFKTVLEDVLGKGKVKDVLISHYMPTPMN